MKPFRDITITRKLLVIAALTNVLALLIAAGSYLIFDRAASRQELVRVLAVMADEIGLHSAASLKFRDETTARETLAGLKADPHVMQCVLFDTNGTSFASYVRDGGSPTLAAVPPRETEFMEQALVLARPVMLDGKRLGTVCIISDLELLRQRLKMLLIIIAAAILLALGLTMIVALMMQRSVSVPLMALADTALKISGGKDYSVRAAATSGRDEVGQLTVAFNQMLDSLQEREAALRLDELRTESLLRLNQMVDASPQQLTDFALEEGVRLTRSALGYLAFMNEDETVLTMHAWSKTAMEQCAIIDKPIIYPVEKTGLWGDAVRQRRPVVTNDYAAPHPNKKGYPAGHVDIHRHMNVPIFDGDRIVAVAGVGNKVEPYVESDVQQLTLLMQSMWRLLQRKRADEELRKHRDHLEELVAERASDLKKANEQLLGEVAGRRRAIEESQQAETKYRTLLQSTDQGIYGVDRDGRCIFINRSAAQMLGYEVEEFLGRNTHDLIHHTRANGEALPVADCPICRTLTTGQGTRTDNEIFWRREGTAFPVEFSSHPIVQTKQVTGAVIAFTDITQRRAAERKLQDTTMALERSNKDLEQFAYVASHDLQEPLRMVASYVQLLARRYKDKLDGDANDFIAFAVDGAKRMQALINDLLAYSRVTSRGKPLGPTDCELILQDALNNLQIAITECGASITHDTLPIVLGDSIQLSQLFQNLLSNAIKFRHRDESPSIHVGAERRDTEWVLSVHDNGIGIDLRHAERIFQIFQRLHTRDEYPGTGIGLAVCKKIVERHGGRIWVESQLGQGATFFFTFPAQKETAL